MIPVVAATAGKQQSRLRIEVLVGNTSGLAFWRAMGFDEYALTMEMALSARP